MDRTQYGRNSADSYKPYDLACKKRPAPGCKYRPPGITVTVL